jgi:uncharacterized protein YndB with AHSA1/START domain
MPDILNKVAIKASPNAVYRALTTLEGLAGWWTADTTGDCNVGGTILFRFGDRGRIEVKVIELVPNRRVLWQVVGGPDVWIGTKVSFDLSQDGDFTAILFKHAGWKEPSEFMHHCTTKWAMFLMSMKSFIEIGKGAAYPNDIHISSKGD